MTNPLIGFQITPDDLDYVGHDLERPECILAERDGTLWSADARGGVMRIDPDGNQELILQEGIKANAATSFEDRLVNTMGSLPNGLAFDKDGNILVANFGTDRLELMLRDGTTSVILDAIDGKPNWQSQFCHERYQGSIVAHSDYLHAALDGPCENHVA